MVTFKGQLDCRVLVCRAGPTVSFQLFSFTDIMISASIKYYFIFPVNFYAPVLLSPCVGCSVYSNHLIARFLLPDTSELRCRHKGGKVRFKKGLYRARKLRGPGGAQSQGGLACEQDIELGG